MARLGISSDNNNGNNIDANVVAVEDTLKSARIALPRAEVGKVHNLGNPSNGQLLEEERSP